MNSNSIKKKKRSAIEVIEHLTAKSSKNFTNIIALSEKGQEWQLKGRISNHEKFGVVSELAEFNDNVTEIKNESNNQRKKPKVTIINEYSNFNHKDPQELDLSSDQSTGRDNKKPKMRKSPKKKKIKEKNDSDNLSRVDDDSLIDL
jgi:hypothetical protein